MRLSNRNFTARRERPRGRHLLPSKQRSLGHTRKPTPSRSSTLEETLHPDRPATPSDPDIHHSGQQDSNRNGTNPTQNGAHSTLVTSQHSVYRENGRRESSNGTATHSFATAVATDVLPGKTDVLPRKTPQQESYNITEADINHMWNAPAPDLPFPHLQPRSAHSLRQITDRRSRTGFWTAITLVVIAAVLTAGVLTIIRGSEQNQAELQAAVSNAASVAVGAVGNSLATLESLREGSSFTPELVSSISALGAASRGLVESAAALPTNESSLAEARISATALAGRISRLGETFGATFSYRGQIVPHLMPPSLTDPLEITNLADNTALLAGWKSRLEEAALNPPSQPRLLQNHQALQTTLPYLSVHLQAYTDAVHNGQPEQATASLSQIASLLLAIGQDLDRAVSEITEISDSEIRALTSDLQNLAAGT